MRWHSSIHSISGKLEVLNPLAVLRRGYSVVFDLRGCVVREAEKLRKGQEVRILLEKGTASARIQSTEIQQHPEIHSTAKRDQEETEEGPGLDHGE